ncbi:Protein FAR1-RELATED SEQUENCE 5 [Hordeum vulgare]|nr:Protein FAR1-RELATED SEQUENCE 5 [Hordeum vulgare]
MFRVGSADQGSNVGLSLNDIASAYEKKLKINRWRQKKLLQVDKKKSANDVQNAHARRAGVNVVKVEKQVLGSTTDESNNCKIPLATLKGKQPAEKYTETAIATAKMLRIEGGNNVQEVVMDWISSSDGAPAANKQASCSSSVRNELIPGHERDNISSGNDDDPNGDTLENIDVGKATQEEKEMDDMFKGSAFPSIDEVTQARELEEGLHFKTRDDAFFFFCTYARKIGFSMKRSTTRRAGSEQEVDKQVFRCTKEGVNKTTERLVKHKRSNCLIRTCCPVEIIAKRDTTRGVWFLRKVRLEHNHVLHPCDWMLKLMRCYKNMRPEENFFIQVLQKARLEPRKIMQIFTAMGKTRQEIMFDTIDISNIACQDRAEQRNTDIEDTMKLFAEMQRKRAGFHHVEEIDGNNVV